MIKFVDLSYDDVYLNIDCELNKKKFTISIKSSFCYYLDSALFQEVIYDLCHNTIFYRNYKLTDEELEKHALFLYELALNCLYCYKGKL